MEVRLVAKTEIDPDYLQHLIQEHSEEEGFKEFFESVQGPEGLMVYVARVSSPNQANPSYAKLLEYCAKHGHWSVFEQVDITFEIITSRAIAQQILRHRSFCFQEFSQRYAKASMGFEVYEARRQDVKNRQNSIDDMSDAAKNWFYNTQDEIHQKCMYEYEKALSFGIAKEQARFLLPLGVTTKLYMKGSLRSWIHYLQVRADNATQKEHRVIAEAIGEQIIKKFPTVAKAMGWEE
jgi:thymidylate synthase (FAD)